MRFTQGSRRKAIEYEKDLVKYWRDHETFEKSVEQRPAHDSYVFYDGPPFITGVPHHGTLLISVVKDAVPRYWTMKGKRVERVWGWDCHGLPAEVFTEKKLGIHDKRDIGTKVSLEEYILTCRENMVQTGNLWEDTIARVGRWVDFKGAYKTMDKPYMESVWWAFKQLYEAGKIYEGEKVLLYCVRDATPISKAEVAMDNSYQDITDPSVYIKFQLKSAKNTYLLAWTTTPWTLPANVAVAVNKNFEYAEVEVEGESGRIILAEELLNKVLTNEKHQILPYKVIRTIKGKELVGMEVEPLFEHRGPKAHIVYHEDYVSIEEGTGIVHSAPAYGEEDFIMAQKDGIPVVSVVDESGYYTSGDWKGQYVWDSDKQIAKELHNRGIVWKIEYIRHSYPHCHRCGTKLMYRAHPSWFMDIIGQKELMLEQNGGINWFPTHVKQGRFAKTIESAPDWNISRDRFWATAMPVWKGKDYNGKEHMKVIGSYAELKELSGVELEDYHRPWVDDVTFTINDVEYRRIDKVLDCWFESGSMPFAQFHYPFENELKFEQNFPGDFIAEYVGQVRAWFYYLHAVSVGLFQKNAFKNVIVTGTLAGNDGRKMSKSFGNYTDPNELMDRFSADALRFLFLSSPLLKAEDFSLQDKEVADVQRKLAMIWNMYDFFTMYAAVDQWDWDGKLEDPTLDLHHPAMNPLDHWVISRLHQLNSHIDRHMQGYNIPDALAEVLPFLDDASNWYVRRSRRRFWKSGDDVDKQIAYRTLHYVLLQLSMILAPFIPFLAEELFLKLTGGELGESVHLLDWPEAGHVNELVLQEMAAVRELITKGLAQRAEANIKVRQPLAKAHVMLPFNILDADRQELKAILAEELNVKEISCRVGKESKISIDVKITSKLKREGLIREVIRNVQSVRKQAGLNVDDRIRLSLTTDDKELLQAVAEHRRMVADEVLATEQVEEELSDASFVQVVSVEGRPLSIAVAKA